MGTGCTYCGSDVEAHDPVIVTEAMDAGEGATNQFCNYACLAAHIDAENLVDGATCDWSP